MSSEKQNEDSVQPKQFLTRSRVSLTKKDEEKGTEHGLMAVLMIILSGLVMLFKLTSQLSLVNWIHATE